VPSGNSIKPLIITAGEPAGIGPELCLALAKSEWATKVVVIADANMLAQRAEAVGKKVQISVHKPGSTAKVGELSVIHQPLVNEAKCGQLDVANAQSLLDGLTLAVEGCSKGIFSALVTAPLQKSVICDAGISFTGHTEFLAEKTGCPAPVMLLVADKLRVALASTHLPLKDVSAYLTTQGIVQVLDVLHADLRSKFGIPEPEIVVCGLNPHAGEGGHLGIEDEQVIAPAIRECIAKGMKLRGPLPADTAFTPAAGHADAVLAMYHDQGLPVVKYAGFGHAINVTLGLPIIRTSVDHGTALDIAGTGKADTGSLIAAVKLAAELAGQ
jgi:4-hydroxythreonine-4-phosphate dehydrogenase